MTPTDFEPLDVLLRRHGLDDAAEEPFPNDGWSGASLTLLRRGNDRFVLKRDSLERDWIARATNDGPVLREAWFVTKGPRLPPAVRAHYLGVARDGLDVVMLMPDLSGVLFDWDAPISVEALDDVLARLVELHATDVRTGRDTDPDPAPWCPLRERVTLICRSSLERPGPTRDAVGDRILPGWDAFDRLATADARRLIDSLNSDPGPLVDVLAALPASLIHGDLKLANAGIDAEGALALVDWQMVSVAPIAIELGWFLVSNVASLPVGPEEVLARYRAATLRRGGDPAALEWWSDQVDAAALAGLLLRGWRKAADAEAGVVHASGIAAADDLAWWCERAVDAGRRLL